MLLQALLRNEYGVELAVPPAQLVNSGEPLPMLSAS